MLQARAPGLGVTSAGAAVAVPAAVLAVVADGHHHHPTASIVDAACRCTGPAPCVPPLEEIVP